MTDNPPKARDIASPEKIVAAIPWQQAAVIMAVVKKSI